jgi:sugar (pentulose or hexulose) kinase
VLLDASGALLGPSWNDRRAQAEHREVAEAHPGLSRAALNLLAKARWWEGSGGPVATAMTAKDFIVLRLTSVVVADPASGGAPEGGLPPLVDAREPWALAGRVTPGAAQACGLPPGTAVAVGWHDGAAAAFGAGASVPGTAAITLGTNAVYRIVTDAIPAGLPHYWDLTPGVTVSGGDITAAGTAIAWARGLFPGAAMERSLPGAQGLTFLPQFAGRIAPDVNRDVRGVFWGLDGSQTPDDLLRAVGEGIAYSLRQVRDHLRAGGLAAGQSVATGGGAHDPVQAQIVADVLQQPLRVADCEEGCRGAALLGAVAAGLLDLETARTLPPASREYAPNTASAAAYDAAYARFLDVQRASDGVGR